MLPIALALMQFAPQLAGLLGGTKAEAVASHVVGIAQTITGQTTPDAALAAIQADPNLAFQFQSKVVESQVEIAQIAADTEKAELGAQVSQLQTVNATMQKEDETRPFSWRDFWGFVSGTGFAFVVGIVGYMVEEDIRTNHFDLLAQIPQIVGAFTALFGIAAAVLGVQSSIETHHAGMADRIAAAAVPKVDS